MKRSWLRRATPVLSVGLFGLALFALHHFLSSYGYARIFRVAREVPPQRIAWALGIAAASYAILGLYDVLAVRYASARLPYRRVALASFVSYAFSHNLGMSVLSSGSARLRFYSSWGLSAVQVTLIVLFCNWTFWLGFLCLGGAVLATFPLPLPPALSLPLATTRPLGLLFLLISLWIVVVVVRRSAPLRIARWQLPVPTRRILLGQILVSSADWMCNAAVLHVLLPDSLGFAYSQTLAMFVLAQVVAIASNVPGGLGVFESVLLFLLPEQADASLVIGSVLAYRVVYFLVPLAVAVAFLAGHEWWQRRQPLDPVEEDWRPRVARAVPTGFAVAALLLGSLICFAGATPSLRWHDLGLKTHLPQWLSDSCHGLAAALGAALVLLAPGLQERSKRARRRCWVLVPLAALACLIRDGEWEVAVAATLFLVALGTAGPHFYRRARLSDRFSNGWTALPLLVAIGSAGLYLFSFPELPARFDWFGRFDDAHDQRLALRSLILSSVLLLLGTVRSARRRTVAPPTRPDRSELETVARWVHDADDPTALLALTGEQRLLFTDSGTCCVAYRAQGRTWIAQGDPIGPREEWADAIARFHALARAQSCESLFFAVPHTSLEPYLDLGLSSFEWATQCECDLERWRQSEPGVPTESRSLEAAVERIAAHTSSPYRELLRRAVVPARTEFFSGSHDHAFLEHCDLVVAVQGDRFLGGLVILPARERARVDRVVLGSGDVGQGGPCVSLLLRAAVTWNAELGRIALELGYRAPPMTDFHPLHSTLERIASWCDRRSADPPVLRAALERTPSLPLRASARYLVMRSGLRVGRSLSDLASLLESRTDGQGTVQG